MMGTLSVLAALLMLTPHPCSARSRDDVDSIIHNVGQRDNYFSTDIHRFLARGKIIHFNISRLRVGNWNVAIDESFGKGYRGPVVDDEGATLRAIFKSLNESHVSIQSVHVIDGHTCNISIGGDQLISNYVRYYRRIKEKMDTDYGLTTLGVQVDGIDVTIALIQGMNFSEEGQFKYLPYEIHNLRDLYRFTTSGADMPLLFTKYEITVDGDCLPKNLTLVPKPKAMGGNSTSNESYPYEAMQHNCAAWVAVLENNLPCLDLKKDLEDQVYQLFLLVVHLQIGLFKLYSGDGFGFKHQICTVQSLATFITFETNLNDYVLTECCTFQKEHTLLYEAGTIHWFCHDPYQLTYFIAMLSRILSFMVVMMFPLVIKWAPPRSVKASSMHGRPGSANPKERPLSNSDILLEPTVSSKHTASTSHTTHAAQTSDSGICEWIFLDNDSEYHFNMRIIFWQLLLARKVNRGMVMLRRLLFLYIIAFLHFFASSQMCIYYNVYYNSTWQFNFLTHYIYYNMINVQAVRGSRNQFDMTLLFILFVIPLSVAVTQFMFLSSILCKQKSIAEILYWEEKDTKLGQYVGIQVQQLHEDMRHSPFETKLSLNLTGRLSYLSRRKFWEYLFTHLIFRSKASSKNLFKIISRTLLTVIFLPILIPWYTLPICTVFRAVFSEKSAKVLSKTWCKMFLTRLVLLVGIAYFSLVLLACVSIYLFMGVMVMINTVRSLSTTLTQIIFLISAIVNISETFSSIEEKYRDMKLMVFNLLQDMSNSSCKNEQELSQSVLKTFNGTAMAIPKAVFSEVCQVHLPYARVICKALAQVFLKLTFLGVLYMVILDYNVLDQFSETGESLISVVFVSIPSLLTKYRSDIQRELKIKNLSLKVKGTLLDVLNSRETCPIVHNKYIEC